MLAAARSLTQKHLNRSTSKRRRSIRRWISSFSSPAATISTKIIAKMPTTSPLVSTFVLQRPEGFKYKPGQAIHLLVPNAETKELQQATFSMTSAPLVQGEDVIEIAVKATRYAPIEWLLETAKEGDSVLIDQKPVGETFDFLSRHPTDPFLFIGAGIGITPILSITQYLESQHNSAFKPSKIEILHQARSPAEFLHWQRLLRFSNHHPNAKVSYLVSDHANAGEIPLLNSELARHTQSATWDRILANAPLDRHTNIVLCGPNGFVEEGKRLLMERHGIPEHRLHSD